MAPEGGSLGVEEDELDTHPCTLPLVRLIEAAAGLATPQATTEGGCWKPSQAQQPEDGTRLHTVTVTVIVILPRGLFLSREQQSVAWSGMTGSCSPRACVLDCSICVSC